MINYLSVHIMFPYTYSKCWVEYIRHCVLHVRSFVFTFSCTRLISFQHLPLTTDTNHNFKLGSGSFTLQSWIWGVYCAEVFVEEAISDVKTVLMERGHFLRHRKAVLRWSHVLVCLRPDPELVCISLNRTSHDYLTSIRRVWSVSQWRTGSPCQVLIHPQTCFPY